MKIKIGRFLFDIDKALFSFIVIDALFLFFFGVGQSYIQLFIVSCCFFRIIKFSFANKGMKYNWIFIAAIAMYLFVITINSDVFKYVFDNIKFLTYPLIVLFYFSCLMIYKPVVVDSILKDKYVFYNIYFFFNVFFMIYQSNTGVFYDSITGLIGPFGTHRLCMFVCFLVLLNFQIIKEKKCKFRMFLIVSTLFVIILTLLISSINDNTAIYIFLPLAIVLYLFNINTISVKMLMKIVLVLLICWIAFQQLMRMDSVASFLNDRLFTKIDEFLGVLSGGRIQEERYLYIDYALNDLNGFKFGVGLGPVRMSGDVLLSNITFMMRNWGMSSMASLISVGGFFFMIAYVILYTHIATYSSHGVKIKMSFCILFFILFYYGITPMEVTMLIFVCFMLYPFYSSDRQLKE